MPDGEIIDIPIDPRTNLPLLHNFVCNEAEKRKFGPAHAHQAASERHEVRQTVGTSTRASARSTKGQGRGTFPSEFDQLSEEDKCLHGCVCTSSKGNQNLSGPQRELLHWHHNLCLNMRDLQQLMKPQVI